MNAMMIQLTNGLIVAERTRAQTVGISSPEYREATSADILAVVIFFVVCILIVAVVVVGIVMLVKHIKGKSASDAVGRSASTSGSAQVAVITTRCCVSCGADIPQASKYCPKCGAVQ